ncbi:hypothetical protein [Frankia sp. Cr2]|uniref:hypothetical protein n=1 Tax=Frankia sp. Cr2 TaxID=3073932 RepID=UPI002AD31E73|nr:hypothetical protein [Frankia sp. Cr2]
MAAENSDSAADGAVNLSPGGPDERMTPDSVGEGRPDSGGSVGSSPGPVEPVRSGSPLAKADPRVVADPLRGEKPDEKKGDLQPQVPERSAAGAGEAADGPGTAEPEPIRDEVEVEEELAEPSDLEDAASNFRGPVGPGSLGGFGAPGRDRMPYGIHGSTINATYLVIGSQLGDVGASRSGADGDDRNEAGSGNQDRRASGQRQARLSGRWAHIPTDIVTWTATAFAEPACFEPALARLEQLHLAMVCARPGFGRPSLGLAMLSRCVVRENIFRIDAQTDPRTLDIERLPRDAGFLIENLDYRLLLDGSVRLDRLAEDFVSKGSYLVITGRESTGLVDVGRYVVDVGLPASAADIMSAQYEWFRENPDGWTARTTIGSADASPADPLADSSIETMLRDVVREGQRAAVVTELARRVAYARTVPDGLEAVRGWVDGYVAGDFTKWISRISAPEQIAFVLALAILNGLPYRVVAGVARSFEQDLRALTKKEAPSADEHVLGPGRGALIEAADAEIVDSLEDSGYGLAPVEAVRFRKDGYQRRVLDWFWREHVDCHELVSNWVRGLTDDPRPAVRARAGAAVGVIAAHGFDEARRAFLLPWSDSSTPRHREAVVGALKVLDGEPELAPHVHRMVLDWGTHSQRLFRRWTAARAWGAGIGARVPELALDALGTFADSMPGDHQTASPLRHAVGFSLLNLFVTGEANARLVLDRLVEWSDAGDGRRRAVAAEGFLRIAAMAVENDTATGSARPALLSLALRDASLVKPVATLVHHAQNSRHAQDWTVEVLRGWYVRAEGDAELIGVLVDIVLGSLRDGRDDERLSYHLDLWNEDFPQAVGRTYQRSKEGWDDDSDELR